MWLFLIPFINRSELSSLCLNLPSVPGNKIPMCTHICSSHTLESARWPLADGWVNRMGYIYKIAFCSVVKNEMILVTGK